MKVSVIVSTYNSERFIRGRLDDLLRQTLYSKGELEIIVINAGSKQGEDFIIREYLGCVTYVHSLREPIYTSWNRGISLAKGEYITNANADDRYSQPDSLEIMVRALDDNPHVALVYADATVVDNAGLVSAKAPYYGKLAWPEFDAQLLTKFCYTGQAPMWRRLLHSQVGMFDESFQLAGDYEWSLRLAAFGMKFLHIPQSLGLFFDDGTGTNNQTQSAMESRRAQLRWKGRIK